MGLRRIRLFAVNSYDSNGYPVLGQAFPLLTVGDNETELNNIRVTLTPTVKEQTLNADDREQINTAVVGYAGTIEAYGVDANALSKMLEATKDANNNIIHTVNTGDEKVLAMFYEGKNTKGKRFQKWLYSLVFKPYEEDNQTETETVTNITLEFNGRVLSILNKDTTSATVYEGNEGFVEGEPLASDLYKEAATPGELG